MKKKSFFNYALITLLMFGTLGFAILTKENRNFKARAEDTLLKTIDFEDLSYGKMSATAMGNSFYDGLIVADGKITRTASAKIDDNTLGLRVLANSTEPRRVTIQVQGYTKIILDIKQERKNTEVSTGCGQVFFVTTNGTIQKDVVIPTYGYHEIILTFYSTLDNVGSTQDCGIDNIRFYGPGTPGQSSSEVSTSQTPSSSLSPSSHEEIEDSSETSEVPVGDYISIRDIASYLEDKEEHYPLSDAFIEKYQQESGGYIDLAKSLGILVDKSQHSPNQKWHFFDSWLYPSIEEGTLSWTDDAKIRVYTRLLCPELLLWIYEACEVPTEKVIAAKEVAEAGKIAGTHVSTIAKNMRACVAWDDLRVTLENFKQSNQN